MSADIHALELEQNCPDCQGRRGEYLRGEEEGWQACSRCNGSGFVPTELGTRVLNLIRHNSRLTVSAELRVAGAAV